MNKNIFPSIELSEPEKIWLSAVYNRWKKGKKVTFREILDEVYDDLPHDFQPRQIDRRLIDKRGEEITLLGIIAIDPQTDLLKKINKVLLYIKNKFLSKDWQTEFQVSELANITNYSPHEIALIFKIIFDLRGFFNSARSSSTMNGYDTVTIGENNSEDYLLKYRRFESIEDYLRIYYQNKEKASKEKLMVGSSTGKLKEGPPANKLNPIFSSRVSSVDPKLCFVLMPFTQPWSDRVYKEYIRNSIENIGLQCLRADNLTGSIIIEDIWIKINQAAFIVADVTGRNPNVMYELGIAHTIGKPVVLITQEINNIPFDFTHLRHFPYQDNIDGLRDFEARMKKVIPTIYKEHYPEQDLDFLFH